MLFTSLEYLLFLFLLTPIYYYFNSRKIRIALLIIASLAFYSFWGIGYTILLLISSIVLFWATILIGHFEGKRARLRYYIFIFAILFNIALLAAFKYFYFIFNNVNALLTVIGLTLPPFTFTEVLPIGISFYTFMAMSYLIDVYRKEWPVEKDLSTVILYLSFFPHLVAGPIMRAKELMPQFKLKQTFNEQLFFGGFKLVIWGLFKKIAIADRLAEYINLVYSTPSEYSGVSLLIGTMFFAIQIYCDFSGYCDIAIGSAQLFGFHLPDNFNRPYFSRSVVEFWRRWNMTLYQWFKDYVYIPLGGSRVTRIIWYRNILIVFLISGLWHGAKWTFVVWGLLTGLLVIGTIHLGKFNHFFSEKEEIYPRRILTWVLIPLTFVIITLTWVFFRASSLTDAALIYTKMFMTLFQPDALSWSLVLLKFSPFWFAESLFFILLLFGIHLILPHDSMRDIMGSRQRILQWGFCFFLIFLMLFTMTYDPQKFIYFQF